MSLLLGQLIYTSFPKVGFQALTSTAVPPEVRRAFVEQIVYQYWDAYNPPSSEYRAVYVHRLSSQQILFGWLYNDGLDDLGRSHVPYFICYYSAELLQSAQLDTIFAFLKAGPVTVLDRHRPLTDLDNTDLDNVIILASEDYQSVRLGVEIDSDLQAQSRLNIQQDKLFRLFVPEESETQVSTVSASSANLALLEELSPPAVLSSVSQQSKDHSVAAAKLELILDELLEQLEVETYQEILRSKLRASTQSQLSRRSARLPLMSRNLGRTIAAILLIVLGLGGAYRFRDPLIATINRTNQKSATDSDAPTFKKSFLDTAPIWSVVLSPDHQTVIGSGANQKIKIWNIETGKLLNSLSGHTEVVRSLALTRDGKTLISGSDDSTLKLWDLTTNQLIQTLDQGSSIWSISLGRDDKTLVSGSEDGTLKIWELPSAALVQSIPAHEGRVFSVAISPDGKTIATGGYDRTIKIWNAETGALLRSLTGHTDAVRALEFSPDGQSLASASWDQTLKLWNWQTGEVLHTLTGHTNRVVAVAFSPDGKTLISGSTDNAINLWSVQSGKLLQSLSGHTDWVLAVASDDQHLVSSSKDQTIRIWQIR
ncbi:WD40 repeat domain-containing protein [Cyanobacteria bacterium FACHB-63]|nr:WD40 repeat domain-containing protein [Cyanobacteria bacterium FACHB-63]